MVLSSRCLYLSQGSSLLIPGLWDRSVLVELHAVVVATVLFYVPTDTMVPLVVGLRWHGSRWLGERELLCCLSTMSVWLKLNGWVIREY